MVTWEATEGVSVVGTSFQGTVQCSRDELEAVFGPPGFDSPDSFDYAGGYWADSTAQWTILFDGTRVVTVYDILEETSREVSKQTPYPWHVGGVDKQAVALVEAVLAGHRQV